ncbi:hypothetical protein BpHYR1_032251 [Brachionus plicatilis]|uniref:Uncharacterized protein n=1 Tax=Brachionus plicatilis TaxID=10195 RepID=A0A3M7PB08_BRAPC|nr:hypothetical protein BpHYR1_032251 [Brachionus plicatilis]
MYLCINYIHFEKILSSVNIDELRLKNFLNKLTKNLNKARSIFVHVISPYVQFNDSKSFKLQKFTNLVKK